MKKKILFFVLFLNLQSVLWAQNKTINGTVKVASTGELLIGAQVDILELGNASTITNAFGFFSLTIPMQKDSLHMIITMEGYLEDTVILLKKSATSFQVSLMEFKADLDSVLITSRKEERGMLGFGKLSTEEISNVPVIFGEKDILKTLQLLPGIKSAGDGNSGFYVRGGGADQNLILLDDAPIYNATHLLGFFSTFNSDAIKDVSIYKGNMPAQYGGRLSAALDIRTNDGNMTNTQLSGGIGIISSRLNLEGPIAEGQGAYSLHARRTYVDLFMKLSKDSDINQNTLNFYDLNAKANYGLGGKDRLYLSAYRGRDNLGLENNFGLNWGNSVLSLRWNHVFSSAIFSNMGLLYSYYDYLVKIQSSNNDIDIRSSIRDFSWHNEWQWHIDNKNKLDFGFSTIYHDIAPGSVVASSSSNYNSQILERKKSLESASWISHDWKIGDHWQMVYGARFSMFNVLGPGTFYRYDKEGNEIDSSFFAARKIAKTYLNVEPRVALSYIMSNKDFIRVGYSRNTQNLHLLSNSTASNPTDVWVSSSLNIQPEIGDQIAIGYFGELNNSMYEYYSEVYYRWMQNQIDYKNGADIIANKDVESQLIYGKGRAYGLENYFKKKKGRLTGWISYTLSKTERHFDDINDGKWFPARQDRIHEISVVAMYQLSSKWTLSSIWVYYTGNAVTFPSGKYAISDVLVNYYSERNGYRMPSYHRLDLGATLQGKKTKKYESFWVFSLFNAYGRENAYSLTFKRDPNNANKTVVERTALFKFIPSVTYNFKFK